MPGKGIEYASAKKVVIESVEQDAEQRMHLALTLDDDSDKDVGLLCLPGRRFFCCLDEIEPLEL